MWKEGLLFIGFFVFFIGSMLFSSIYDSTLRQECRTIAMQKNYTPVEIQVLCKL